MSVSLQQAAENVKSLGKTFQSVIDLGTAIEGIVSIEQAEREATERRDAAYAERDTAIASAEAAQQALLASQEAVQRADEQAALIVQRATDEATHAATDAEHVAQRIVDAANARAAEIDAATAERTQLLRALETQVGQKRVELAEIDGKISALKSDLAKFIQ